jgi:hypothetical protein
MQRNVDTGLFWRVDGDLTIILLVCGFWLGAIWRELVKICVY